MLFSDIAITLLALNLPFMKPQISISYIHWELCSCPLQRWACTCLVKHHQSLMSSQIEQFFFSSWWPKIYVTGLRNIGTIKSLWAHHQGYFSKQWSYCTCVCQKENNLYQYEVSEIMYHSYIWLQMVSSHWQSPGNQCYLKWDLQTVTSL